VANGRRVLIAPEREERLLLLGQPVAASPNSPSRPSLPTSTEVCQFGPPLGIGRTGITTALRRGYIELYPCGSESEALLLEGRLIAELDPVLNVKRT
jgi:hypothetical protein